MLRVGVVIDRAIYAQLLGSALAGYDGLDTVAVADIEWGVQRALHERYRVEAVPMIVIADAPG